MKIIKHIFILLLFIGTESIFAAHETVINSYSGNLSIPIHVQSSSQVLSTGDQWYSYVLAHQSTYHSIFTYKNAKARVVLRYDDSRKQLYNTAFGVEVSYYVTYWDATGHATNASKTIDIDYNPSENSAGNDNNDISVQEFPNAISAQIHITSVSYYEGSPSNLTNVSVLPTELSDVYLDVEISNDKFYNLDVTTPPVTTFPIGFSSTSPLVQNQLPINWNYVAGAESYDLEWLFVDQPNESANGGTIIISSLNPSYDFRNATRINTSNNFYNIPMSYPSGILLFRVRAVGYAVDNNGVATPAYTSWCSYNTNTGTATPQTTSSVNNFAYRYNFAGMKTGMNWSYSASYVEEGKRQEAIVYSDGVSKARQHITLNYTDSTAIISETKYDYQGRAAVQIIPTPNVNTQGLTYYPNFATNFSKNNFDLAYIPSSGPVVNTQTNPIAMTSLDMASVFYGVQTFSTGANDYIPNASGYPYAMTTFLNDGTDRIAKTSGVGPDNKIGSGHETKYYYGSVTSQTEIDALFGNEVGNLSHYHKTMVIDPNGQTSVSYHDQEDRTIATCIAGLPPSNLVALDNAPTFSVDTNDILSGNDHFDQNGNLIVNSDLLVTTQATYTFNYSLNTLTPTCAGCTATVPCPTCKYDININIIDQDNGLSQQLTIINSPAVSPGTATNLGSPISIIYNQVNSLTIGFTVVLSPGKYKIVKSLSVDQANLLAMQNQYINNQNLNHTCDHIPPIQAPDCGVDCSTRCTNSYIFHNTDGTTTYLDENGNSTTQTKAIALINQCLTGCNSVVSPPITTDSLAACSTRCQKSYSYTVSNTQIQSGRVNGNGDTVLQTDLTGPTVTIYIDDAGNVITQAQAEVLIALCEKNCGTVAIPGTSGDPCQAREDILKQDMSPGGQYFDNTYDQYTLDANGNQIVNNSYNINGWLATLSSTRQATLISAINSSTFPASNFVTFNDIRNNWQPGFESITYTFHPEYPLYVALCYTTFCSYTVDGGSTVNVSMSDVNSFGQQMTSQSTLAGAVALGYLNPTQLSVNATTTSTDLSTGNTTYISSNYVSSGTTALDPLIKCNNTFCCVAPRPYPNPNPIGPNPNPVLDFLSPADTANTTNPTDRSGCTQTAYDYFNYRLTHFYNIQNTGSSPSPNYLSIWYVMDDPLGIHTATGSNGSYMIGGAPYSITDDVVQYFQGLASAGVYTNSTTKYNFFMANYRNLRDLLIYELQVVPLYPNLPLQDKGNNYSVASVAAPGPQDHYIIRIQGNPYYAASVTNICSTGPLFNGSAIESGVANTYTSSCAPACQQYVDSLITQFAPCLGSNASVAQTLMINLCTGACVEGIEKDPTHPILNIPASGCHPSSTCTQTTSVTPSGGQPLYTFNEILNHFGCSGTNVQTVQSTLTNQSPTVPTNSVQCACKNLSNFVGNYITHYNDSLGTQSNPIVIAMDSYNDPLDYSFYSSNSHYSDMLSAMTSQVNTSGANNYSTSDMQTFLAFCDNPANTTSATQTLPSNFPSNLLCQQDPANGGTGGYTYGNCGCQNLNMFISAFGYNPLTLYSTSTTAATINDLNIITADINDAFGTTVTEANLLAWLTECNGTATGQPNGAVLDTNNFPMALRCPNTGNVTQDASMAACLQQGLLNNIQASANTYLQAVQTNASAYVANYKQNCLNIGALDYGNNPLQHFTMMYTNYLFLYTLYYYDQADNLVKTVPPEGFNPLTTSAQFNIVAYHRANPTSSSFPALYPSHGLITNYKYNTLNHVTAQTTPDGGTTNYRYDALGRLAVSQNAKQATSSTINSNALNAPYNTFTNLSYSYTKYDDLGRIIEVGECQNASAPPPLVAGAPFNPIAWLPTAPSAYREVTHTFYDDVNGITTFPSTANYTNWQNNLRNRISSVIYVENPSAFPSTYDRASHYSYDSHGNVTSFVSENTAITNTAPNYNAFKRTDYDFDIVSGKVNAVHYQSGMPDQFHHQYYYDSDNRLHLTLSSHDSSIWEKEVKYFYYSNGPLARTELGDKQVAGQDHTYTIQGWLKSINNNYLNSQFDIGDDAYTAQYKNLDKYFAADAMGFTLGYFANDYIPRNSSVLPIDIAETITTSSPLMQDLTVSGHNGTVAGLPDLFNGNIRSMSTALYTNDQSNLAIPTQMPTMTRLYFYDQLNRIKFAKDYTVILPAAFSTVAETYTTNTSLDNNYYETFSYDFNGNITALQRTGLLTNGHQAQMDALTYNYNKPAGSLLKNNKLNYINDAATSSNFTGDIDDQSGFTGNNYQYDTLGNLAKNQQEEIASIEWNVYGKIRKITRNTGSAKSNLEYLYDPMGQRVVKIETPAAGTGTPNYTYYSHDAQGNVMAIYNNYSSAFNLIEQHLYGSKRLGIYDVNIDLTAAPDTSNYYTRYLGNKQYELSNHLGNVLQTISDRKLPVPSNTYHAEEYFETYSNSSTAQHYQGKACYVMYNNAQGTYIYSPGFDNIQVAPGDNINTALFSKAPANSDAYLNTQIRDKNGVIVGGFARQLTANTSNWVATNNNYTFVLPSGYTQLTNPVYTARCFVDEGYNTTPVYIDNLTLDVTHNGSLQNFDHYIADVLNATDYYAFGAPMPGRSYVSTDTRYGYQGSEKDDEISGRGNSYTTKFRELDTRLGRWWSIDPKVSESESPYSSMANSPIWHNDIDGDEVDVKGTKKEVRQFLRQLKRTTGNKYGVDKENHLYQKGNSTNIATDSKKSGELSALVGSAIADEHTIDFNLTSHNKGVTFDKFLTGEFDVSDIKGAPRAFQAGILGHVFSERLNTPGGFENRFSTDVFSDANFSSSVAKAAIAGAAYVGKYNTAHGIGTQSESSIITGMTGMPFGLRSEGTMRANQPGGSGAQVVNFYHVWSYGKLQFSLIFGVKTTPVPGTKLYDYSPVMGDVQGVIKK